MTTLAKEDWRPFDYDNKAKTAPKDGELVWVVEENYVGGISFGFFDGFTFCTWWGSDDCHVTHWAPIVTPEPPVTEPEEEND